MDRPDYLSHELEGLDMHYDRREESEFLSEYLKAIDFLTIDPNNKLQRKYNLKQRQRESDQMLLEMQKKFDAIEKRLGMR